MNKLLTTTAIALLLGVGSAYAAEDPGQFGEDGQPATESTVSPDAAKEAKIPDQGEPDTSGGAKERSSAPPDSGAVLGEDSGDASSDDDAMSGAKKSEAPSDADQSDSSME